ncbi:MAG: hypothetical protein ACJA2X_000966 [Halocynthiibacter sp.]|jgi:hypothetical protein
MFRRAFWRHCNGNDAGYDTIAEALMKCRDGSDLYIDQITFDIPSTTYASNEAELVVEARRQSKSYVWNNAVHSP